MDHFTPNEWSLKTQEAGDGVWIFLPLGFTEQLTLYFHFYQLTS